MSRWIRTEDQKPPEDTDILAKFKHGIIKCQLDCIEEESGLCVGYTYMWQDFEFYIREWMLLDDFNKWAESETV